MTTQFVLGRAGSGKTRHCIDRIVAEARAAPLGPPIYFIVPRQATFVVQRRLAVGEGLPGFCRIRVTSFDRLAETLLAESGGLATPVISTRGRRLMLTHVLRQLAPQLSLYRDAAQRIGLAAEIDRTLAELDRNDCSADRLQSLIEQLAADDPPADSPQRQLINKLRDLLLIQSAYSTFLGQDRIDPQHRLAQLAEAARQSEELTRCLVFVDGHLDFSMLECRLLTALAQRSAGITITALVDPRSPVARDVNQLPDELSLFHRTELAYRRLHFCLKESDVAIAAPVILRRSGLHRAEALQQLEATWFADRQKPDIRDDSPVRLIAAPTRRSEVTAAAVVVRQWLVDGLRPREVLVLCRSAGDYHELIEATFAEFGIPFFSDRRRPATHHPLLQMVRAVVQAWLSGFSHDAMMTLAKCRLTRVTPDDADRLENFTLEHNLSGGAWAGESTWAYATRSRDEEHASAAEQESFEDVRRVLSDPVRAMVQACPPTGGGLTVRQLVAQLLTAINYYGAPTVLATWIEEAEKAEHFEIAAEHQQVWAELTELLDELVDLLGDDAISPAEFEELIETSLAEFDLAIAPATLDAVMVGEVERTRFEAYRGVVALGWNEGEFPRAAGELSVLGDADRRSIGAARVELDPDSSRQLLNEPLLAYLAITRATERLAITCHESDNSGRPVAPSTFLQHLGWLLGRASTGAIALEKLDQSLATPRAAVQCVAEWARHPDGPAPACIPADIYAALAAAPPPPALHRVLKLAWPALSYINHAELSPEVVKALYTVALATSVSRLETFAACPFKHFAARTLRLVPRLEPTPTSSDIGTLLHDVLEQLVRRQIEQSLPWHPDNLPAHADIRAAVEIAAKRLRESLMLTTAQHRQMLRRAESRLAEVMQHAHEAGATGRLAPLAAEVVFDERDAGKLPALALTTPNGRSVLIRGKIDRVDRAPNSPHVVVFDYKTSQHKLALGEVYHGLALQLLTYLLLLEASGPSLAGSPIEGAAALYITMISDLAKVDDSAAAPEPGSRDFALRNRPRGLIDLQRAAILDTQLAAGQSSSVIQLKLTKEGKPQANQSDTVEHDQYRAILKFVQTKITALADEIMNGVILAHPYRIATRTACAGCDFRSVCRFDPALDYYHVMRPLNRETAIAAMTEGTQ